MGERLPKLRRQQGRWARPPLSRGFRLVVGGFVPWDTDMTGDPTHGDYCAGVAAEEGARL